MGDMSSVKQGRDNRGVFERFPGVWCIEWYDERGRRRRLTIGKRADAIRAVEILQEVLDCHESHWVFPASRDYRPMDYGHFFNTVVRPILTEIGAGNLTWHSFRHTCASWLVQDGVPLKVIQKIMRHFSIRMTERYAHLGPSQEKEASELLATATINHETRLFLVK